MTTLRNAAGVAVVLAASMLVLVACRSGVDNDGGTIVLNEISYHPVDGEGVEFVELYNPGDSALDITGWCFTRGVTGCFSRGTTIDADGYVVATADSEEFTRIFSSTADIVYDGRLSNRGEKLRLDDAAGRTVFSCSYGDTDPWPVAADGHGPSLERVGTELDCSDPRAWTASMDEQLATPGRMNSPHDDEYPFLVSSDVSPLRQADGTVPVRVIARDAEQVHVEYVVGTGGTETIELERERAHASERHGNDRWYGEIAVPASAELLRFRAVATSAAGREVTQPSRYDSVDYTAVVLGSPTSPDLPVLSVHVAADDAERMESDPEAKLRVPAVVVLDGVALDSSTIGYKGSTTLTHPKKQFEIRLPKG